MKRSFYFGKAVLLLLCLCIFASAVVSPSLCADTTGSGVEFEFSEDGGLLYADCFFDNMIGLTNWNFSLHFDNSVLEFVYARNGIDTYRMQDCQTNAINYIATPDPDDASNSSLQIGGYFKEKLWNEKGFADDIEESNILLPNSQHFFWCSIVFKIKNFSAASTNISFEPINFGGVSAVPAKRNFNVTLARSSAEAPVDNKLNIDFRASKDTLYADMFFDNMIGLRNWNFSLSFDKNVLEFISVKNGTDTGRMQDLETNMISFIVTPDPDDPSGTKLRIGGYFKESLWTSVQFSDDLCDGASFAPCGEHFFWCTLAFRIKDTGAVSTELTFLPEKFDGTKNQPQQMKYTALLSEKANDKTEAKDTATGIAVSYDKTDYTAPEKITVNEIKGYKAYTYSPHEKTAVFDISALCSGKEMQPSKEVTVSIPVPDGFDEKNTSVYAVDKNGKKTNMNAVIKRGEAVFETDTITTYIVVDETTRYLRGDVDKSGKVDAADARLALRGAVGLTDKNIDLTSQLSTNFLPADTDRDGKLTASDARLILRAAVGLEKLN